MDFQTKQTTKDIDINQVTGAKRDSQKGKPRFDLIGIPFLYRLSALLVRGAEHYGERNWEKGQNVSRTYASLFRHVIAYGEGERTEDHLAAIAFNVMSIMNVENGVLDGGKIPAELLDLPFYKEDDFFGAAFKTYDKQLFAPLTDLENVVLAYMGKVQEQNKHIGIYWFDFKTVWTNTLPTFSETEFTKIMVSLTQKLFLKPVVVENKVHPNYALLGKIQSQEDEAERFRKLAEEEPEDDYLDSDEYCYSDDDDEDDCGKGDLCPLKED